MTPPYMFFEPANGPRSSRHTDSPARAATRAAAAPAGPAPTTITSKSGAPSAIVVPFARRDVVLAHLEPTGQGRHQGGCVGDHGQVGHGHHRAALAQVHGD